MIKPNSEKCHIKGGPTTLDTVRPSHSLRRTKQFIVYTNNHNAVSELHVLAAFGSSFTVTTLSSMSGPVSTGMGDRVRLQFPVLDTYLGM